MAKIDADCGKTDGGWRCTVTIRDVDDISTHDVTVTDEDATRLAAATAEGDVERLLYETFDFLLEREPKERILPAFDLAVVSRYFPEYEHEIHPAFWQSGIAVCPQQKTHIFEFFGLGPSLSSVKEVPVNVLSEDTARRTGRARQVRQYHSGPGPDVCDGHPGLDLERGD